VENFAEFREFQSKITFQKPDFFLRTSQKLQSLQFLLDAREEEPKTLALFCNIFGSRTKLTSVPQEKSSLDFSNLHAKNFQSKNFELRKFTRPFLGSPGLVTECYRRQGARLKLFSVMSLHRIFFRSLCLFREFQPTLTWRKRS
jgi:hypothetical protein